MKVNNKAMVLKSIALSGGISRVAIAKLTGLTMMTVCNLANELLEKNIIFEQLPQEADVKTTIGRKPTLLAIGDESPCLCGMLIKRGFIHLVICDLSCNVIDECKFSFLNNITEDWLLNTLKDNFNYLKNRTKRKILGVGISSIGPIDDKSGSILAPPDFYDIKDVEIVKHIHDFTGLPTFLINDANAGALAEKVYGTVDKSKNFIYLHIMNGNGVGLLLNDHLYQGDNGRAGEFGHSSINFSGLPCQCGQNGCLDMYANLVNMNAKIQNLLPYFTSSRFKKDVDYFWCDILDAASSQDPLAIAALDEFCDYLSFALCNLINLFDVNEIIVGYDQYRHSEQCIVENMLKEKIVNRLPHVSNLNILHSSFGGNAPLFGAIALLAEKIFSKQLEF